MDMNPAAVMIGQVHVELKRSAHLKQSVEVGYLEVYTEGMYTGVSMRVLHLTLWVLQLQVDGGQ
jgi:hypothetical protein